MRPPPSGEHTDDVRDGVERVAAAVREQRVLQDLAHDGMAGKQWQPPARREAGPQPGPRDRGERGQVHELIQLKDVVQGAGPGRPRPIEQREVDDQGDREYEPAPRPAPWSRPRHADAAARSGAAELPVSRTALLTAAATAVETSGWKTLGTM